MLDLITYSNYKEFAVFHFKHFFNEWISMDRLFIIVIFESDKVVYKSINVVDKNIARKSNLLAGFNERRQI